MDTDFFVQTILLIQNTIHQHINKQCMEIINKIKTDSMAGNNNENENKADQKENKEEQDGKECEYGSNK